MSSFEEEDAPSRRSRPTVVSPHRYNSAPWGNSTSAAGNHLVSRKALLARLRCDSAAFCGTLWRRSADLAEAYFFGNGDDSDDHFVEVVQQGPLAAQRFFRIVMAFSVLSSTVVCASCAVFLPMYWDHNTASRKPLKTWLLMHCVLLLMQIPVRIVFLAKVGNASVYDLEGCVSSIATSPAWRMSKLVSNLAHAWFTLGLVWMVNAGDTAQSTGVYKMMFAAIAQVVARAVVGLVSFRLLISGNEPEDRLMPSEQCGAEPKQISVLPLVRFKNTLLMEQRATCAASCAICLSDYQSSELLRRLPCGHYFHRRCADDWLCRSKRCPLCMQAIDMK